jgi:hypothetical protein
MSEPPATRELCELAAFAAWQAGDVRHRLGELARLVELSGVELPAATRRELDTELQASMVALHAVQLGVCEPRRGSAAGL